MYEPWSGEDENGLGFGLGSTDGVVNQYAYRGFHRERLAESKKVDRDALSMRNCKGAYKCHFDPEYDIRKHTTTVDNQQLRKEIIITNRFGKTKKVFCFIGVVAILLLLIAMIRR